MGAREQGKKARCPLPAAESESCSERELQRARAAASKGCSEQGVVQRASERLTP